MLASTLPPPSASFVVTFERSVLSGAFSGKAVVYLSKRGGEPRFGPNWFSPEPVYSADFKGVNPGDPMEITAANSVGFPGSLSRLEEGDYTVQVVLDRNLGGREIGGSPGNLYSKPIKASVKAGLKVVLSCDQIVAEPTFVDTEHVKGVRLDSKLLGKFYGRPTPMMAAVVLPKSWADDKAKKFPVIYSVPGFGGDHWTWSGRESTRGTDRAGTEFIFVALNPSCPGGHSVFADSANNGPWGKALTEELIPYVEKTFRGLGKPEARFTTGHSSGGWSSLWLQVAYPDFFGGCWSTSPDPVDFRDFQRINIYQAGENMFTDPSGAKRPIARRGETPMLWYKDFSDMERPIRGEQLGSFETCFSPRSPKGEAMQLWDRDTGAINSAVATSWKKYDIGLILRSNWSTLGPKLKGKIHVYMGETDTFYLEGAVKLLKEDMRKLGSDAKVELFPGDHGTVMTAALRSRIDAEMAAQAKQAGVN